MSQQKRRFEASAKHCRLFQKQKPLAPRNGSGEGPYAQTTAAPALRTKSESNLISLSRARRSERF